MTGRYHCFWLGVLVAVAFAIRMGFCAADAGLGRSPASGYREYVIAGTRLLTHGTLVSPFVADEAVSEPSSLMPPIYAGIVAGVYGLLGVESFMATLLLQLINAASTSITVLLTFAIARRLGDELTGWLAALVAAINPALVGFTGYIWDTSLFTLGVTASVWVALRLSDRPFGWCRWAGFGLLLGVLALLSPALTVAYPFLVLWPACRARRWQWRIIIRAVIASLIGWLIAIGPWTIRNYVHFGELTYIRGGFGLELWLGVCPEAESDGAAVYRAQFPLNNPDVQERVGRIGEAAFIKERGRLAVQTIADDPWRYVRVTAIRIVDYWAGSTFSHARPGESVWPRRAPRAAVMLFMSAEVLLFLACVCWRRKIDADTRWLLAIVLSFALVYCLTHVQIRFRAPAETLVAVVTAASVVRAIRGQLRGRFASDPGSSGPANLP